MTEPRGPRDGAGADRDELLNALQDAQLATAHRLVPEALHRGLTGHTFWPLYWLSRVATPRPTRLARTLGITASGCTAIIDQLVEHGFVRRRTSELDRRQVVLEVTPKGRRTLAAIRAQVDRDIRAAMRGLPAEELASAARVLRTVAHGLDRPEVGS